MSRPSFIDVMLAGGSCVLCDLRRHEIALNKAFGPNLDKDPHQIRRSRVVLFYSILTSLIIVSSVSHLWHFSGLTSVG